jgi:hypothetical protein
VDAEMVRTVGAVEEERLEVGAGFVVMDDGGRKKDGALGRREFKRRVMSRPRAPLPARPNIQILLKSRHCSP